VSRPKVVEEKERASKKLHKRVRKATVKAKYLSQKGNQWVCYSIRQKGNGGLENGNSGYQNRKKGGVEAYDNEKSKKKGRKE